VRAEAAPGRAERRRASLPLRQELHSAEADRGGAVPRRKMRRAKHGGAPSPRPLVPRCAVEPAPLPACRQRRGSTATAPAEAMALPFSMALDPATAGPGSGGGGPRFGRGSWRESTAAGRMSLGLRVLLEDGLFCLLGFISLLCSKRLFAYEGACYCWR
jgi:hypothetical protein